MLSESVHSVVDSGNEVLLLYGQHRAAKPPDQLHPWGYGREIYFWSFVVALLIFALGAGVSIYEGIVHIRNPEPMSDPLVNFAVYAASAVFEGISWWFGWSAFQRGRGNRSILKAVEASKDPPSFMVLFEDSAALIGLAIAAVATGCSVYFGKPWIDGAGSILIGLVLAGTSTLLLRESKSLLIGERADPALVESLLAIANAACGRSRANGVLTIHLAPDQVMAAMSFEFDDALTAPQIEQMIADIEQRIRDAHPEVTSLFIKPQSPGQYAKAVRDKFGDDPADTAWDSQAPAVDA